MQATIKSTLGPYGGDLLMVDANGKQTITNDGATVMKVRIHATPESFGRALTLGSFWTLSTPPPAFSSISPGHKMPKSETAQHLLSSWLVRS